MCVEQGASASQMAAATFLDPISEFIGMAGEAKDAVSAYNQVKMIDVSQTIEVARRRMSKYLDQDSLTTKTKNLGTTLTTLWFLLNGICKVTRWQVFFGRRKLVEVLSKVE